jgi:S-adenosylmethionine:tRNA ribosyltransferase-isomerase
VLTADFDYELPEELIAAAPPERRDGARMLVVDRASGSITHRLFTDLPEYLRPGDIWVLNNSRVERARFYSPDGSREILRLQAMTALRWRCMVRPGKKFRLGDEARIGPHVGRVVEVLENGERIIEWAESIDEEQHGHLALPHYMKREDGELDKERYQTVFAKDPGSIAAPTAGLHFTPEILARLPHTFVTLHVGVGTFQPVKAERVEDHVMHSERYEVSAETAARIQSANRVVCVGTTACRTLESVAAKHGQIISDAGATDIFIHPGYSFKAVDALLTNFHLPKSSLIMLVSALAGKEVIMEAYRQAVEQRYRFYSYGDCMLIL